MENNKKELERLAKKKQAIEKKMDDLKGHESGSTKVDDQPMANLNGPKS